MADQREIDAGFLGYDPVGAEPAATQQYANFSWESRWNRNQRVSAAITQSGSQIMLTTVVGCVSFDLASPHDDIGAFSHMMAQAIEMLQKTKREYDETMRSADEDISRSKI